eukprot:evm.model.scf_2497EXC.2 EVM.evm.TU.scf_2497EXC.2   scf_2497EXC:13277-15148(+)
MVCLTSTHSCVSRLPRSRSQMWAPLRGACSWASQMPRILPRVAFRCSAFHAKCTLGADEVASNVLWQPVLCQLGRALASCGESSRGRGMVSAKSLPQQEFDGARPLDAAATLVAKSVHKERGGTAGSLSPSPNNNKMQQMSRGRRRKRGGITAEQYKFIGEIRMACKHNNVAAGFTSFRNARRKGVELPPDALMSMMFLASGADDWMDIARQACTQAGHAEKEENTPQHLKGEQYGKEILDYIKENDIEPGEIGYIAQARIAAVEGDPGRAFEFGKEAMKKGHDAKLRMFQPALLGFAISGDAKSALVVDHFIRGQGLDLTEHDFSLLLEACSKSGSYEDFVGVASRVGKELNHLQDSTLHHIETFFRSERAREGLGAAKGGSRWELRRVTVEADGHCRFAGGRLERIDLNKEEFVAFAEGVRKLVLNQESGESRFQSFVSWLDKRPPAHVLVDGANVAFYGQNKGGKFQYEQIGLMMQQLQKTWPNEKPLLVLGQNRTRGRLGRGPARLYDGLAAKKELFATPQGSNDDWYWLYAAVRAGHKGILVSNDEMRDHIFDLLAPKYVLKWKENHQLKYRFVLEGNKYRPVLTFPNPYTSCTQLLKNGAWMFPSAERAEWLCAKPV